MYDLRSILAPEHSAVLVIDMQNDFVSDRGTLAAAGRDVGRIQAICAQLRELLRCARDVGVTVVHIRTLTLGDHRSDSPAWLASKLKMSGCDYCLEGTWGADFFDGFEPLPDELVISKHRSSAFVHTDLDATLRSRGLTTLVVTGECTEGCVEATYRHAAYLDYYNVLLSDCVASYSQELHDASLRVQRARHCVLTADLVESVWKGGSHASG